MLVEGRHATGERAYRVSKLSSDDETNDITLTQDVEDTDDDIVPSQSTDTASQVTTTDVISTRASHLKRTASSPPTTSLPPSKRSKLSARGPAVVRDVGQAIREFSASMSSESTPKRRRVAVGAIEQDETFATPEKIKVWNLFYRDIAAADMYMAINDQQKCNQFIRGVLDMSIDESENPFL